MLPLGLNNGHLACWRYHWVNDLWSVLQQRRRWGWNLLCRSVVLDLSVVLGRSVVLDLSVVLSLIHVEF